MKQDIVIVSTNDWNGFWFQRQEFATRFASEGHRVFYINRIIQRVPKPGRVIRWLLSNRQVKTLYNPIPVGVTVFSPRLLPPLGILRPVNRMIWKRFWKPISAKDMPKAPVLISYQPTYNVQDLADLLGASKLVYVNTHVYDADPSCPKALLKSESEVVGKADVLMADSAHNQGRLEKYKPSIEVTRAKPGVSVKKFYASFRGDEAEKRNHLLFFGDIGRHLDIDIYNKLAENYKVTFIGIVDQAVAGNISDKINILPPVAPAELPDALKDADILTIFYKVSSYVNGIIPAKFFECLAAGKPLFVSGLPETRAYKGIYDIKGSVEKAVELIGRLGKTETDEQKGFRRKAALEADWENRFNEFSEKVLS